MSFRAKPLNEQEELVVRRREKKKQTFREIGTRLGVTRACAGQIYIAASAELRDLSENGGDALLLLPSRVRRGLVHREIDSRALARAAIESGRLSGHEGIGSIRWHGGLFPKVGRQTWAALYE
jgi:hypothetical protein